MGEQRLAEPHSVLHPGSTFSLDIVVLLEGFILGCRVGPVYYEGDYQPLLTSPSFWLLPTATNSALHLAKCLQTLLLVLTWVGLHNLSCHCFPFEKLMPWRDAEIYLKTPAMVCIGFDSQICVDTATPKS